MAVLFFFLYTIYLSVTYLMILYFPHRREEIIFDVSLTPGLYMSYMDLINMVQVGPRSETHSHTTILKYHTLYNISTTSALIAIVVSSFQWQVDMPAKPQANPVMLK